MSRYTITVPPALWQALASLSADERNALLRAALANRPVRPQRVAVLASDGRRLDPCLPTRARQLVARGRAVFLSQDPPTIRLRRSTP